MKKFLKNLLNYYQFYKLYTGIFFFGVVFGLGVESLIALSFKYLLDNAIMVKNETILIRVIILLIVSTIVAKMAYVLRFYLYSKVASGITRDVRNALFKKLQRLSLGYYTRVKSGDILSYFSMDIDSLETLVLIAIPASIAAFLGILINVVIIFVLEWKLAIIALIGLILCVLGPYLFSGKTAAINDDLKSKKASLLSVVEENIGTQKVIRSFNLDNIFLENYLTASEDVYVYSAKSNFLNKLMEIVANIIIQSLNVVIICIGAYMAFKEYITPGTLVAFNSLFIGLIASVMSLTRVVPFVMKSSASLKRLWHFLEEEEISDEEMSEAEAPVSFQEKITFENVTFAYEEGDRVLENINLTIPRGASVAFVGPSGSGKSSIVNLLMAFYEGDSGSIKIDGRDISGLSTDSYRQLIGIVHQENILFNTTIKENFKLIDPSISDEAIYHATKLATIHEHIEHLPKGYDTLVGERGRNLSNVQRQKLAVARALIYKPSIFILDEATSALDHKTEQTINSSLKNLTPHTTVVNITHRLENIQGYDLIYVLDQGRIVEEGNHDSLLALDGVYSQLYGKQKGFHISDDSMHAEIQVERLAKIHIFKGLKPTVLTELKDLFVSEYYPTDRKIIRLGEYGDRFYVIVRGKVEISIIANDGSEAVVKVLEDGDYFGEIALLRKVPRTANIAAKEPCLVLSLRRSAFESIISKTPELRVSLEDKIDKHLAELEAHK